MRTLHAVVGLAASTLLAGCGGSGGGGGGSNTLPYTFRWTATVTAVEDGSAMAAVMPGVTVGATLTATVVYDPAQFTDGVSVGDGRRYAAPAGLLMTYAFSSGGQFTKQVTDVSVRDGGTFDQWNWLGGDFGGLLFQVNDPTDVSVTLPVVIQFATVHADFVSDAANFQMNGNEGLEFPDAIPANRRVIRMSSGTFQVLAN